MNQDERRQLDNQLMKMGLARLADPELLPQLAYLVVSQGPQECHIHFRELLNACEQSQRREMYEAMRPHLRALGMEPRLLETYMQELREHAANIESRSAPVELGERVAHGGMDFEVVPENEASGCILKFTCHLCARTSEFYGDTPMGAVILARQDGWVRDKALAKEVCPKCPAERTQRKKCPTCSRRHHAPECRALAVADDNRRLDHLSRMQGTRLVD